VLISFVKQDPALRDQHSCNYASEAPENCRETQPAQMAAGHLFQSERDQEQSLDGYHVPIYRVFAVPIRRNERLFCARRG
jgi:hypothetical protein